MPTYSITGPDGKKYRVTGDTPEGAYEALQLHVGAPASQSDNSDFAKLITGEKRKASFEGGMAGAAALGAADTGSFGFGDELGAGLGAASEYLASFIPGQPEGRSYDELLGKMRDQDRRAKETNPGSYLTGQIAGGVGQGVGLARGGLSLAANAVDKGASLARVSGMSLLDGAALGSAQGLGSGEGTEDRLYSAGLGGLTGGGLGVVAPGAVAAVSKVAKGAVAPFVAPFMPEPYAQDALAHALRRSGKTPDQIADTMRFAADEGQPMYNMADAMGYTGQRLMSTVARNPNNERQAVVEGLHRRQSGQGERLSQFVAEGLGAGDTAAQRQAALTEARTAEANRLYTAARRDAGAVNVSPVLEQIDQTLSPGVNRIASPRDNIAYDSIEGALSRVRRMLSDGNSQVSDFDTLFRAKLDIDDMIQRSEGQGAGNRAHYLSQVQRQIDNALADASPSYAQARDTFARDSRRIEAVDTGKAAFRQSARADDTTAAFAAMTPEEQAAFRAGYADPAIARLEGMSMSPTTNKARVLQTPKYEQEFPAFAAPGEADRLGRRIKREQDMFDTTRIATGGSATSDNIADAADLQKLDPSIMSALLRQDYVGALMTGASKAFNTAQGMPPSVTERLAKAIMGTDPDEALRVLSQGSKKLSQVDKMRANIVAALLGSGAAGAGRL